jgi:hypothetical protein
MLGTEFCSPTMEYECIAFFCKDGNEHSVSLKERECSLNKFQLSNEELHCKLFLNFFI